MRAWNVSDVSPAKGRPQTLDSGPVSTRSLHGVKQRVFRARRSGWNRATRPVTMSTLPLRS